LAHFQGLGDIPTIVPFQVISRDHEPDSCKAFKCPVSSRPGGQVVGYWLSDRALDRLRMRQAVPLIGGRAGGRVGAGRTMGGAARGLIGADCDSYRQKKAPVKGLRGWGWGLEYDQSGSEH